jgi:hypothetical protein
MRDVIIAGAGYAGISAAWELRDRDVLVVEASERVGGRGSSESLGDGGWANWGGAYFTRGHVRCADLALAAGVERVAAPEPIEGDLDSFLEMGFALGDPELREIEEVSDRLRAEQSNVREPASAELDRQTAAEWIGPVSPPVRAFFDHWAQMYLGGGLDVVSLFGCLLAWGPEKTTPFPAHQAAPTHGLGPFLVQGGTAEIPIRLIAKAGTELRLNTEVVWVTEETDSVRVFARDRDGTREFRSRSFISAMPAQRALFVIDAPGWKREALAASVYGRRVVTAVEVLGPARPHLNYTITPSRPGQTYESYGFSHRVPLDRSELISTGGAVNCEVYDRFAGQLWHDPDESIVSGVGRRLLFRFPELEGRLRPVRVQRWLYGLPRFVPGKMSRADDTRRSHGRIHYCGDFTYGPGLNLEAAARSGAAVSAGVVH